MLKYTNMNVKLVDYKDLNYLVNDTYKALAEKFHIASMLDLQNDSYILFHVSPSLPSRESGELSEVIDYTDGDEFFVSVDNLLDYMCYSGHIEAGDYLVSISW